jgi:hypothetical protein
MQAADVGATQLMLDVDTLEEELRQLCRVLHEHGREADELDAGRATKMIMMAGAVQSELQHVRKSAAAAFRGWGRGMRETISRPHCMTCLANV